MDSDSDQTKNDGKQPEKESDQPKKESHQPKKESDRREEEGDQREEEGDQLKKNVEARREELAGTLREIGNRVDIPRTTFVTGMITGFLLLVLLNRILFRPFRKKRHRRCCC